MKDKLQIKEITKLTGLDRETLRFYEQKGLLPQPTRTEAGYREFDSGVVVRIKFIKLAQEIGFSLKEIAELLALGRSKTVTKKDLEKIAAQKVEVIDQKIHSLKTMKKTLLRLSERAGQLTTKSNCPILSQFKSLEI